MRRFIAFGLLAASLGVAAWSAAADSTPPVHLRGQVDAVTKSDFELTPSSGAKTAIGFNDATRFASLKAAQLSDITQGMFVGTAAIPQADGTLKAVEVHIFPENLRGAGEGYRPFPQVPQGTMTNATVTSIAAATASSSDGGKTLTLTYKDGHQTVVVPKGIPIVLLGPADASMLKPRAMVSVTATKDAAGKLTASRVLIGLEGVTPPI